MAVSIVIFLIYLCIKKNLNHLISITRKIKCVIVFFILALKNLLLKVNKSFKIKCQLVSTIVKIHESFEKYNFCAYLL